MSQPHPLGPCHKITVFITYYIIYSTLPLFHIHLQIMTSLLTPQYYYFHHPKRNTSTSILLTVQQKTQEPQSQYSWQIAHTAALNKSSNTHEACNPATKFPCYILNLSILKTRTIIRKCWHFAEIFHLKVVSTYWWRWIRLLSAGFISFFFLYFFLSW